MFFPKCRIRFALSEVNLNVFDNIMRNCKLLKKIAKKVHTYNIIYTPICGTSSSQLYYVLLCIGTL